VGLLTRHSLEKGSVFIKKGDIMQPLMRKEEFLQHQFNNLIAEQQRTNNILQEILDTLKPPVKEVEQIERNTNDSNDKRKRR
jgi:hypothetical protein